MILACNGYGGNKALVAEHIPQMADALYFGHPGNQGDAILWGSQGMINLDKYGWNDIVSSYMVFCDRLK